MRNSHPETVRLLEWIAANGPAHQREMSAAGFVSVSAKVNYLRDELLIEGVPSDKRGYVYSITPNGSRRLNNRLGGDLVPPRTIAFTGIYRGDWNYVRPGGMDAMALPSLGVGA